MYRQIKSFLAPGRIFGWSQRHPWPSCGRTVSPHPGVGAGLLGPASNGHGLAGGREVVNTSHLCPLKSKDDLMASNRRREHACSYRNDSCYKYSTHESGGRTGCVAEMVSVCSANVNLPIQLLSRCSRSPEPPHRKCRIARTGSQIFCLGPG